MRYVDRANSPYPSSFLSPEIAALRRNLLDLFSGDEERQSQTFVVRDRGTVEAAIQADLKELFHDKCAYCEMKGGAPYRFRPDTEAEPVRNRSTSHLYYAWLTTSWDNWLWICSSCRPDNPALFPVIGERAAVPDLEMVRAFVDPEANQVRMRTRMPGTWPVSGLNPYTPDSWSDLIIEDSRDAERNLLLDPCTDRDLWRHLSIAIDGELIGLSRRGEATIAHFKLQRREIVASRREAVAGVETAIREGTFAYDPWPEVGYSPREEFFGSIQLRLRFLVQHMALAAGRTVSLQWSDLDASCKLLRARPDWEELLGSALQKNPREIASKQRSQQPRQIDLPRRITVWQRVKQIEIRNFKSLESVCLTIPLHDERERTSLSDQRPAGSLLILGENATGKSSILEAAVLCLVDAKMRAALPLETARLILDPSFMDPDRSDGPASAEIRALFDDGSERVLTIGKGPNKGEDPMQGSKGPALLPVFAYGAFRQYLKRVPRRRADDHVATLFATDRLLPNPTKWLLSLDSKSFNMVARSLHSVFAVEGDYDVIERDGDKCYIVSQYDDNGAIRRQRTPLDTVSSGFRAVLAMTCDIMCGLMRGPYSRNFQTLHNARGIVFIDEIEAHLHPRWKITIMASLRQALPQITFVVTSHDPLCLRGMANGEVKVLQRVPGRNAGSRLPVAVEVLSDLPNVARLTVEQLLTSDLFSLRSTDDPHVAEQLARMADNLSTAGTRGSAEMEMEALRREIAAALPIGQSEAARLVQEAVANYLKERGHFSDDGRRTLRDTTRRRIIDALRAF